jgi:hypothetical protein
MRVRNCLPTLTKQDRISRAAEEHKNAPILKVNCCGYDA